VQKQQRSYENWLHPPPLAQVDAPGQAPPHDGKPAALLPIALADISFSVPPDLHDGHCGLLLSVFVTNSSN